MNGSIFNSIYANASLVFRSIRVENISVNYNLP